MADRTTLFNPLDDNQQWQVTAYLVALSPQLQQSVQRITWAVREVLPQMLSAEGEFTEAAEKEYRKPPSAEKAVSEAETTKVRER